MSTHERLRTPANACERLRMLVFLSLLHSVLGAGTLDWLPDFSDLLCDHVSFTFTVRSMVEGGPSKTRQTRV